MKLLIFVLIVSTLLGLVFWPTNQGLWGRFRDPVSDRFRNVSRIGVALTNYKNNHAGELPARISELVPRYVSPTNIEWFFWPPRLKGTDGSKWDARKEAIEQRGAFGYLG